MMFRTDRVRAQFPALSVRDDGRSRCYLDNPAGTQVPGSVATAINDYMLGGMANDGGHFTTSMKADAVALKAHEDAALFLGAGSHREIVIGQSMTSLTFHMSRSICRDFQPGDEIVITRMEHEGNVGPWLEIAKDKGLTIRWVDFDRDTWQVEPEALADVIGARTRLVTLNHASNMTGSINDIPALARIARDAGALVFVDAVQLAPHHLVDVQALGCDFLVCSAYKFFGPHLGIFWGREEVLRGLHPYKGRCVTDDLPGRFESGTPQFELLAGLSATVAYFEDLGRSGAPTQDRRAAITEAYRISREHEEPLTNRLIDGLSHIQGVTIYGITNPNRVEQRVPTVSMRHATVTPSSMAKALADVGIQVWHGHNYAFEPARALGLPLDEGVVRIGLAHYNTQEEVEHTLQSISDIVARET